MANTTKMEEIKHITKGNITRFIDSERLEVLQRELADMPMKIARAIVVGTKKKSKYGGPTDILPKSRMSLTSG